MLQEKFMEVSEKKPTPVRVPSEKIYLGPDVVISSFSKVRPVFEYLGFMVSRPIDIHVILGVPVISHTFCAERVKVLVFNRYVDFIRIAAVAYFNPKTFMYDVVFIGRLTEVIYYLNDDKDQIGVLSEFAEVMSPYEDLEAQMPVHGLFLSNDHDQVRECIRNIPDFNLRLLYLLEGGIPSIVNHETLLGYDWEPNENDVATVSHFRDNQQLTCCVVYLKQSIDFTGKRINPFDLLDAKEEKAILKLVADTEYYSAKDVLRQDLVSVNLALRDYSYLLENTRNNKLSGMFGSDEIPNGKIYYYVFGQEQLEGMFTFIDNPDGSIRLIDISKKNPYFKIRHSI